MSMSASFMTTTALLPPSSRMVRPNRGDTVAATLRPMLVEPVNEISGNFGSSSMRWPTARPGPTTKPASAPKPSASKIGRTTLVMPIAQSGVWLDGFHNIASPQT